MEFLSFAEGSFLWYWFRSMTGLNAMTLSLIVTSLVVMFTRWTPRRNIIKAIVTIGLVATLPLGLMKLGFIIPPNNTDFSTYLNFLGAIVSIGVGLPYLFHQTLRAASGQHTTDGGKYEGKTVRFPDHKMDGTGRISPSNGKLAANDYVEEDDLDMNGSPQLTVVGTGREIELGSGKMTIGRALDNDIVIEDPTVSRYHARISRGESGFRVEDCQSMAGTMVDGEHVSQKEIHTGATIKLGNT